MRMTVQSFTVMKDKEGNIKKDNFGNTQMMIKFAESPETAYKAVKDPATITEGKVMNGEVVEGQYGFRFQADPYNAGAPSTAPVQQQTAFPVQSDDTRELLLAIYKAVTGEEYSGAKKETASTQTPVTEPTVTPDEVDNINLDEIDF